MRRIKKPPKHGLLSTYTNHGCRCPKCKAARLDYGRVHAAIRQGDGFPANYPHQPWNKPGRMKLFLCASARAQLKIVRTVPVA